MMHVETTKKQILIVDDCPIFIKLLSSLLSEDFAVQTASSGEEAIDLLQSTYDGASSDNKMYSLIITDLEMPGISGFDVADYMRGKNRENKYVPVIMLTGVEVTKEEARKHGCAAFVPKSNLNKVKSLARILSMK